MTIDERLEFLLQSTESLHASTHELHTATSANTAAIASLRQLIEKDAENIRRLASIAAAHENRLDDLEGGKS